MRRDVAKPAQANIPVVTGPAPAVLGPAEIDESCRWPLAVFFVKGGFWLLAGVILLFLASIKLHGPGFLAETSWLSLGRIKPAAMNLLVYGFATQYAFGMLLWMLCRLGRTPLLNAPFLYLAAVLWNVGVFLGWIGILAGHTTGYPYLEMPKAAWPFLFVALGIIALWGLLTFHYRRERQLYVSQWFLVSGLFWFPWMLSSAVCLLMVYPVRGVMQGVVYSWYGHNLLHLWLTPVGLGAFYYFVPKLLGRPLYSRELALFGFWTLAVFGGWGGLARLAGGPLPNWMVSTSIVAQVLMIVPLLAVVSNLYLTLAGRIRPAWKNLVLRFVLFGLGSYLLAGFVEGVTSFRTISQTTLFTLIPMGVDHLILLGFFGMTAMGAAYYILPRIAQLEWPPERTVRLHFNASAAGLGLYVLACLVGGWVQGSRLNHVEADFMSAYKSALPFAGLATLGIMIFLAGQAVFFFNLIRFSWRIMAPLYASCLAGCRAVFAKEEDTKKAEVKA